MAVWDDRGWETSLSEGVVDDLLAVRIRYPWKQLTDSRIGLHIDFVLCLGDRFRGAVCRTNQTMAIPEGGVCFLDDGFPDMVPDTGRVQGEFIRVIARRLMPDGLDRGTGERGLRRCCLVSGKIKLTETMKIMASFSRDISLHSVVSSGLPMGTNAKPGGGSLSTVICEIRVRYGVGGPASPSAGEFGST